MEQRNELPAIMGGLLGEWFYAEKPMFIEHFDADENDPAYFHLKDVHTVFVMPQYEQGVPLNATMLFWTDPSRVDVQQSSTPW